MDTGGHTLIDALRDGAALARWRRYARAAARTPLPLLRRRRAQARRLRAHLDALLFVAEDRLGLPLIGNAAVSSPPGADWAWRPQLWRTALPVPGRASVESRQGLGEEATVFHDCRRSELSLRQVRNRGAGDLAAYGLRLDVFGFDGSFLSVALELPAEAARGLTRRHLIRLAAVIETERPLEIFARLNIRHGPNTERVVRELPVGEREVAVEFDLAYTRLDEKRSERLWLDLIFENPRMNQVTIRDLTLARLLRAAL